VEARLRAMEPAVHLDASRIRHGVLAVNPIGFDDADAALLGACLRAAGETT
jgi:D-glucosaminate-6-phosphate ammonia-lyase